MGDKDRTGKYLEDYNDVFADIYNTLLFHEAYLKENQLRAGPTESIYKASNGNLQEQRRDILKTYQSTNLSILSLGIENQASFDKTMPVRLMGYDYASYREMINNNHPIEPVITIVLNFSNDRWSKAKSLFEMMHVPEELKDYVQDYKILVYDIAFLEDDVIERFTSDFKLAARFFKEKRLRRNSILSDRRIAIKHVEAVLELLSVFSKDKRYQQAYSDKIKEKFEKGDEIYMCYIAEEIEEKGIEKGIEKGLSALVISLKPFISDFQELYQAVIQNDIYRNVTEAQVRKFYQ